MLLNKIHWSTYLLLSLFYHTAQEKSIISVKEQEAVEVYFDLLEIG